MAATPVHPASRLPSRRPRPRAPSVVEVRVKPASKPPQAPRPVPAPGHQASRLAALAPQPPLTATRFEVRCARTSGRSVAGSAPSVVEVRAKRASKPPGACSEESAQLFLAQAAARPLLLRV